ncbi:MAG TPA: YbaB/EbfC family nucleoid-associated protein [Candidatus Nitrosocosmicus sp.]|nr:YbaB/EbfC family nucleoid-associated protein [Candidatus Nitrosocosmicus sp.]
MFNPLKGLGDLNQMRQQAQKMQELLKKEEVTVERQGVKIVLRGDQQVKLVEIDGVIENRIAEAMNEAFQKTQKLAAQKLMEINK